MRTFASFVAWFVVIVLGGLTEQAILRYLDRPANGHEVVKVGWDGNGFGELGECWTIGNHWGVAGDQGPRLEPTCPVCGAIFWRRKHPELFPAHPDLESAGPAWCFWEEKTKPSIIPAHINFRCDPERECPGGKARWVPVLGTGD